MNPAGLRREPYKFAEYPVRFRDGPDDRLRFLNNERIMLKIGKSFHIFL